MTPVIGYVRVSLAREDMISPEIQREAITRWAAGSGRTVAVWIEDLDATGRNFRRKVTRAIARVRDGGEREIAVYRYDRWGRNAAESLANVALVEEAGGRVVSVTEPFDAETAIGRFGRTTALAVAQLQSDMIGENWRAVHEARVQRAMLPATGRARFGYVRLGRVLDPVRANVYRRDMADPAGERYEPDPVTGPVLASLYRRYIAGEGTRSLAAWLNTEGHPTVRGGRWDHRTVRQVLSSGFGAGLLRIHPDRCKSPRHNVYRCGIWVPGAQAPVITGAEWEAFLARHRERAGQPAGQRDPKYTLSGFLVCGTCGGILTCGSGGGGAGNSYRCPYHAKGGGGTCATGVYVRRERAQSHILAWLETLLRPTPAAAVPPRPPSAATEAARAAKLAAEEARIRRSLARLLAQRVSDEEMPPEVYEEVRSGLLGRLAEVTAQAARAQRRQDASAGRHLLVARTLAAQWEAMTVWEKREALRHLVARVVVTHTGFREPAHLEVIPAWDERA